MMNHRKIASTSQARTIGKGRATLEGEIARLLSIKNSKGALYLAAYSYGPELLEFLVSRMSVEDDARAVLSMAFEEALNGISSFTGRATFRTWLYILAKNARARFFTDPYRYRGRSSISEISGLADSIVSGPPKLATLDVERIRRDLDEEDQELLTLCFDRQLSWAEIAAIWSVGREPLDAVSLRSRCNRLVSELTEQRASNPEAGS